VKPAKQALHYPLAAPVQAEQPVKQFEHELGAIPSRYLPVMQLLHLVAVPSRQVAQSVWQFPQVFEA
jgi:hypothetical protein